MAEAAKRASLYAVYWLYRFDPAFTRLPDNEQREGKAAFLTALERRDKTVTVRGVYSMVGLRGDADLLIWALGPDLDAIQRLAVALRKTGLGRYLLQVETYVGVTTPARYDPEHQPAFATGVPAKQYISVYPFVKTTEWFLLSYEQRRDLMAEHGLIGRKYAVPREKLTASAAPARSAKNGKGSTATAVKTETVASASQEEGGGVLANTVDAFGLGDYEFILANESDDPAELAAMMMALRATEVRRYTKLDTPIFFGRLREPAQAIEEL
jgi:hydrogen peroxide-dependent heme synthase